MAGLYILTISPAQERSACKELRRLGFDAYAPEMRYQRRIQGRYRVFSRALIPGYAFVVSRDIEADDPVIRHAEGVAGILGKMDEATANDWLGGILLAESFGWFDSTIDRAPKLKIGSVVKFLAGSFKDQLGRVTKIGKQTARVEPISKVWYKSAEVSIKDLRPVGEMEAAA